MARRPQEAILASRLIDYQYMLLSVQQQANLFAL